MKKIIFCLIIGLIGSCGETKKMEPKAETVEKKIEVVSNPNIHTSHIIELFVWPGEYPTRPMIVEAQQYFKDFKDHPAIKLSDSLLINEIYYFDELSEILLYLEEFPSNRFRIPLEGTPYGDRANEIQGWVNELAQFYADAKVDAFLQQYDSFYEGANEEVRFNLPSDNFISLIEDYYRDQMVSYTVIPAPEMPTGGAYGTRGIGPYVRTPDGMAIYQIISASLPVDYMDEPTSYESFGFNNRQNTLRMSYHEFGHAFVNPLFENDSTLIQIVADSEHLFTDEYKEVMTKINYGDWLTVVQEYLVRLGEIRLAVRSGKEEWAEELRAYHIEDQKFVLMPYLEKKVLEYENKPEINSFKEFLPDLLSVFTNFKSEDLQELVQ